MADIARLLAATIIVLGGTPVFAQSSMSPTSSRSRTLNQQDKDFLSYAAEDNQAEIALCLLAEKKAEAPAIRAFARLMVDDHTQIESRLAAVADGPKFALPEGPGEEGKQTHDKLAPLTGAEFDASFMQAQIKDHGDDLKRFGKEISTTKDDEVRQFASETAPLLEQHLALAKAVQTAVKTANSR
jgi:putative membrane protein